MKTPLIILIALLLLSSCSEKEEQAIPTDWGTELIGVGYAGENPDSLCWVLSFYPCENNQPERLNHLYQNRPKISGDTIIIHNTFFYGMLRDMPRDENVSKGSSKFLISNFKGLYKFSKTSGHSIIPETFYYRKSPNEFPTSFSYQSITGFDIYDRFDVELMGSDSINVRLDGGAYDPYLYEQKKMSRVDKLFIGSYLNLMCKNRYDTSSIMNLIICGASQNETLVYNDSLFRYETYFVRPPGSQILLNYLRSKIDAEKHHFE